MSTILVIIGFIAWLIYTLMDTYKALGYYTYEQKDIQEAYEEWVHEKGTFRVMQNGVLILVILSFLVMLLLKQFS